MPHDGDRHYPLASIYRRSVARAADRLISQGRLRPLFLLDEVASCCVHVDELRRADPALQTLRNVNTPADYVELLKDVVFGSEAERL